MCRLITCKRAYAVSITVAVDEASVAFECFIVVAELIGGNINLIGEAIVSSVAISAVWTAISHC